MDIQPKKTSFFWPVILVGAGVILLLRNFGVLENFDIQTLFRLWPLILVVIGLDLIFGHRFPWAGALIGLLTIGGIFAFLYYAPKLGINPPADVSTEVLSTPLENTSHVQYNLNTSYELVSIKALPASTDLIKATIVHHGTLNFTVTGDVDKIVSLSETSDTQNWFSPDLLTSQLKWEIGLNPAVPTALNLDGGSGALDINLTGIDLESLNASFGSGASSIILPTTTTAYTAKIDSGSGAVRLSLPSASEVTLILSSGSGAVNLRIPDKAELRVEVLDGGSGSVHLPGDLELARGSGTFENDSWQTTGYEYATSRVTIRIINRGSGSISINRVND